MKGFRKFLMQGNIIDLAVAVVVGVAFNAIVQALVKDMIGPLISVIIGDRIKFSNLSFQVNHTAFVYGDVVNAAVSFLVIAAVIYWLIVAPTQKMTALANRNKAAIDQALPRVPERNPDCCQAMHVLHLRGHSGAPAEQLSGSPSPAPRHPALRIGRRLRTTVTGR